MDKLNCRVCFSENLKLLKSISSTSKIYKCKKCSFHFVHPIFTQDDHLTPDSWIEEQINIDENLYERYRELAINRSNYYKKSLNKDELSILEVGCGVAGLANHYQDLGLNYIGIDQDKNSIEYARSRGRKNIFCEDFLNNDFFENQQFDVICFSQVLEHVDNPVMFMSRVEKLLKLNGLFHLDVPNHSSLSGLAHTIFPLKKNRLGGIIYPHHCFAYSKKSLAQLTKNFHNVDFLTCNTDHKIWGAANSYTINDKWFFKISDFFQLQSMLVAIGHKHL